jgi:hypothetical protein
MMCITTARDDMVDTEVHGRLGSQLRCILSASVSQLAAENFLK